MAYVHNSGSVGSPVQEIRIVKDFLNVFLEELPGLPPNMEVEFRIELLSGIASISIAPYRMAPKGSFDLCMDYRQLNKLMIMNKYTLLRIDDKFCGASIFLKIDLHSGNHQLKVNEIDVHKTAFRSHCGSHELSLSAISGSVSSLCLSTTFWYNLILKTGMMGIFK
ncbi:Transposon Ty3-G Gag-Pol polyprotein [Gossypium australe]|uniref:Transposon Ty3-G Gag-Pol polyprotein n=1 Tax=Gossypium australe TaxID=47621 RepID=A0A5B6VC44_9ROSI|nr:Transposon Ty3-G Gag-Pol polyprotein [Gossypium australe]